MHELLRILPMSLSDFLDEWFENGFAERSSRRPRARRRLPRSQGSGDRSAVFVPEAR